MSVRRSLVLSFAQRYTGLILQFGATLILSRLLTPHEIGVFSVCAAMVAIAHTLRDFGVSDYLIQEQELTHDRIRAAFTLTLCIAWSLALLLWLLSGVLADFYREPALAQVLPVLAANFVLLPVGSPAFALLSREMAFGRIYIIQTSAGLVQSGTAVALAYAKFSSLSLALGSLAGTVVTVVLAAWFRPRDTLLWPGLREWRHVTRFTVFASGSSLINEITRNAHEFVLGRVLGFASVGLYSRASGLIETFHSSITAAIIRVMLPAYAQAKRGGGTDVRARFVLSGTLFAAIACPFFAVVFVLADPLIRVLFGDQWLAAIPVMQLLAINAIIYTFWAFAPQALTVSGAIRSRFRIQVMMSPIQVALVVVAAHFGLIWVAVASTGTNLMMVALHARALHWAIGYTWGDLMRTMRSTFPIVSGSALIPALIAMLWPAQQLGGLLELMLGGLGASVGWLGAVLLLSHPLRPELLRAWDMMRRRLAASRGS
ncbi:lipopolysaccharide biosynthesis protein [Niveibacterium sp. SC-1]|uniref:lipopolysaccharide biosynthesis protein n=1 Tax=Niveibacterium sp. SC-1 TaxID=3135646 RepID=UPI00311D5F7F